MTYRTPLTLLFAAGLALGGQARAEGTPALRQLVGLTPAGSC